MHKGTFGATLLLICPSCIVAGGPRVANTSFIGFVSDPALSRDSCGSALFGSRALWTCRDTTVATNGQETAFMSNSASWTNLTDTEGSIIMYGHDNGQAFYPYSSGECDQNQGGACGNGTRLALWPDSPPLVTNVSANGILAYTWIKQTLLSGLEPLVSYPATSLYRVTYSPTLQTLALDLPTVQTVQAAFWNVDEIAFGDYGGVVVDETAFLYSQTGLSNGSVYLAQVPVASIEERSAYQFWVSGAWTNTIPAIGDNSAYITATTGTQGTFYYDASRQLYVWIGQTAGILVPEATMTTASAPQGPWSQPVKILDVIGGNASIGTYSFQAHPSLVPAGANEIFLSYTQVNSSLGDSQVYNTPLYLIRWQDDPSAQSTTTSSSSAPPAATAAAITFGALTSQHATVASGEAAAGGPLAPTSAKVGLAGRGSMSGLPLLLPLASLWL